MTDEVNTAESTTNSSEKSGTPTGAIAAIGLVVLVVIGIVLFQNKKASSPSVESTSTKMEATTSPASSSAATQTQSSYKDGTYEAVGNYVSPGGDEELGVKVILKDGVIEEADVTPKATRPNSVKFQNKFASGYKEMVIGKKLDDVKLSKVSGSSLAPMGFNDALDKIKTEAKA
jgi:uncharacterized protein with FMN-binding domain